MTIHNGGVSLTGQSGLVVASYPNPQERADRDVPLGWCNNCIAEAKAAEEAAQPAVPIWAGVTLAAMPVQVDIPGVGRQWAIANIPLCWRHLSPKKTSPLLG